MMEDRYEKERRLGRNEMGTTWQARDTRTGFSVAVKEIESPGGDDAAWEDLEPLQRAREAMECLQHPGLPSMLDHYDDGAIHGLVCEWVEGQPLSRHQSTENALPSAQAWEILKAGLDILAHLHTRSPPVVHGDVHPDNLLVDAAGKLHLVGFPGIDRIARTGSQEHRGASCAAPEILRGEATPASDLYALGVSLCAAITGTTVDALPSVPGWGGKRLVLDRVLAPGPLREVLQSLVEPDQRRRPASVEAAQDLVQAALDREELLRVAEGKTSAARQRAADARVPDEASPNLPERPTPVDTDTEILVTEAPQAGKESEAAEHDDDDDVSAAFPSRSSPPWALIAVTAIVVALTWLAYQGDESPSPTQPALVEGSVASTSPAAAEIQKAEESSRGSEETPEDVAAALEKRCDHLRDSGGVGAWRQLLKDAPGAPCAQEAQAAVLSGLDKPAMRSVTAGSVVMGQRESPSGLKVATVTRPYAITTTEVTRHLFEDVTKDAKSKEGACKLCPVDDVSWWEAVRFANALSQREGLKAAYLLEGDAVTWDRDANGYRLPTSAEWERAARSLSWKPDAADGKEGQGYVATNSMRAGAAEWVWDSYTEGTPPKSTATRKGRVQWVPVTDESHPDGAHNPRTPGNHPDCVQGGRLFGPDFAGGPGFASSVTGNEDSRASLGRKRSIAVEPPGKADVGAVVTIRHGKTDKLRRRLPGHTNTQVFARAFGSAWIFSYAVDGELRLWDPRKGSQVAQDRYLGGDLSPQGATGGRLYAAPAGRGEIALLTPRFLTLWRWDRKNRRANAFLDLIPPAWDPAVVGGVLIGPGGQIASVKDDAVTLWGADGKERARLEGHEGPIRGALDIGSDLLATWGDDHTLRLWSWAGDSRAILSGHERPVLCVEELRKKRLISRDMGGRAVLWDTVSGQALGVLAPQTEGDQVLVAKSGAKPFKKQIRDRKRGMGVDPALDNGTDRTIRGTAGSTLGSQEGAPADTRRTGLGFRLVRHR